MNSDRRRSRKDLANRGHKTQGGQGQAKPLPKPNLPDLEARGALPDPFALTRDFAWLGEQVVELAIAFAPQVAIRCAQDRDYSERISLLSAKFAKVAEDLRSLLPSAPERPDSALRVKEARGTSRSGRQSGKVHHFETLPKATVHANNLRDQRPGDDRPRVVLHMAASQFRKVGG